MRKRRVVVTGTGVLTSLADEREKLHDALCAGSSGIKPVEEFAHPALHEPLVGEITSFDPATYLEKRNYRPLDRTSLLLASAAQLTLDDSGWTSDMRAETAVGLVVGTTFCSVHTISKFDCQALTDGPKYTSPLDFANTVINAAAGQCAIWHQLRGANSTVSSGITSALEAIGYAAALIQEGHEQAILAGGVEELCVESLLAFQQAGLLCTSNGTPAQPPMPFDRGKHGFALSEGSALLMLEELEAAQDRGATILAEIKGHGSSFDCGFARDGSRGDDEAAIARRGGCIAEAMERAIESANLSALSIDAMSASANGDRFSDQCEVRGIIQTFNGRSDALPITASKAAVGESMGASGAVQAVDMIAAMHDGRLSPSIVNPGIDFPLRGVSSECREIEVRNGLVNSVGLDGNCCSLVIGSAAA